MMSTQVAAKSVTNNSSFWNYLDNCTKLLMLLGNKLKHKDDDFTVILPVFKAKYGL